MRGSSNTMNTVLRVISRDRPKSQVMCMALPVENLHVSHHKRTCDSLGVWHFMFLPATRRVRVFSATRTPKTRRPTSRRRNCYSRLKKRLSAGRSQTLWGIFPCSCEEFDCHFECCGIYVFDRLLNRVEAKDRRQPMALCAAAPAK